MVPPASRWREAEIGQVLLGQAGGLGQRWSALSAQAFAQALL